jgi:hypothetical protein
MDVDVPVSVNVPLIPSILLQRRQKSDRESSKQSSAETSIIGVNPSYLMVGGLVFTVLTKEYIHSEFRAREMNNFEAWANEFELLSMMNKPKSSSNEEAVLLSQVIAHNCNIGYESMENMLLSNINGVKITNMQQVKDMIDSIRVRVQKKKILKPKEKNLMFEFSNHRVVILDAMDAFAAEDIICRDHGIASYASLDLM